MKISVELFAFTLILVGTFLVGGAKALGIVSIIIGGLLTLVALV